AGRPPGDPFGTGPHELPGLQAFLGWVYAGVFVTLFLVPATLAAAAWTRKDWPGTAARTVLAPVAFAAGVVLLSVWETDYAWIWTGVALGLVVGATGIRTANRTENRTENRTATDPGGRFRWAAPFVVLGLAVALLNTVLLATLLIVAEWLGTLRPCHDPRQGGCLNVPAAVGPETPIAVFPMIRNATPYLIVIPLLLLACFLLYQGIHWWISGRTGRRAVVDEYSRRDAAAEAHPEWWVSAVAGGEAPEWQRRLVRRWPGG
ncbi:hypothetical protein, partial [Nonomuraea antimicrobica]|uniref:hypothetical protein n=1 Tax=Nonomuraea antimicrobica TaxID=561173 RepID=UPI0031EEF14F